MSKIDKKIDKAANDYAKSLYECGMYEKSTPATPSDMMYAFIGGARWALSHQWRSVEEDGLPEDNVPLLVLLKDDKYPLLGECRGGIWEVESADLVLRSNLDEFLVTHWMPIPPMPEARKEGDK